MSETTQHNDQTPSCELTEEQLVEEACRRGEAAAEQDFKVQVDALTAERDDLLAKIAELEGAQTATEAVQEAQDRVMRIQADWENYRRRVARERIEERERAAEKLVVDLLPVVDDMERAIAHAAQFVSEDENLKQFSDGIEAVHAKMLDVFTKHGVEVVGALGEAFDPIYHKAVGRVEDASQYADTVHDVYQNGYRIGDKVIREAMVTVSFGGDTRPKQQDEKTSNDSAGTAEQAEDATTTEE